MAHTPPLRPVDLERALATHPNAAELRATWDALPPPIPADAPSERRARAWERLAQQLDAPERTPYADDVPAPLHVVAEDARNDARDNDPDDARDEGRHAVRARAGVVSPRIARANRRWRVPAIATAAAAMLAVTTLGVLRTGARTIEVKPGDGAEQVRLADGSDVTLAAGAVLRVPRALGWPAWIRPAARDVELTGAAFFVVSHDGRPFTVRTPDAAVRVLGTRFEVRAPVAGIGTRVAVESGRVEVRVRPSAGDARGAAPAAAPAPVTLGAGERTVVPLLTVARTAPARIAAWRTGGFAAVDEPLAAVLAELSTRFAVRIDLRDSSVAGALVSLFYANAPSLETVLTDVCTAQGLTFRRVADGYRIERAP